MVDLTGWSLIIFMPNPEIKGHLKPREATVMKFETPEWHDRLPSTNSVLLDRIREGENLPSGFVLAAREQTEGRGRYDRTWVSQAGQDLTFSALICADTALSKLVSLPMAVALAVVDVLDGYGISAKTKWPNDVLVNGAKICGLLAEHSNEKHLGGKPIVLGMGLNVNMEAVGIAMIGRAATSIRMETGKEHDVEEVLTKVLAELSKWLEVWEKEGFAGFRKTWTEKCCFVGEEVSVGEGATLKTGVLVGFGDQGQLLLQVESGEVEEVWAGDVV